MNFEDLVKRLSARLKEPLPGSAAHELMRATPVGPLIPDFRHKTAPKPGAVLIMLYEQDGSIRFPLIKRQEYLGAHSGQVSLPGGKSEAGEDAVTTALREAREEIGIVPEELSILGTLTEFFVIPSNFLITPVIACSLAVPEFNPDPREVSRILTADLSELLREGAIQRKEIIAAGSFRMNAPHFEIEREIVWGATAMMLNEFCHVVREVRL